MASFKWILSTCTRGPYHLFQTIWYVSIDKTIDTLYIDWYETWKYIFKKSSKFTVAYKIKLTNGNAYTIYQEAQLLSTVATRV